MSNKYFTVKFPTKPFLVKYLHSIYGNPIIFNPDNFFSLVLAACLEKDSYRGRKPEEIRNRFDKLTTNITLHFPISWLRYSTNGNDFKKEKILFINKLMEERFREDLYRYCFVLEILGVSRQEALEQFAKTHSIEIDEDITFDNLKKMEYRYREKVEKHSPAIAAAIQPSLQLFATG